SVTRPGERTVLRRPGGRGDYGRRVHIVHNWSWEATSVPAPVHLTDVLDSTSLAAGAALALGPWDVRVLVSADID
ncbi:Beta-galactosidase C-terminal domain, partial [Streptomyces shenzhenensis]|uniref:Beta-galactosidase C-terminal domain n=1 Tax=Streptomyces shenzhenensis TaxID=943815 RepID=UPI0015EFFE2D